MPNCLLKFSALRYLLTKITYSNNKNEDFGNNQLLFFEYL
jgi:hypothetical protein